MLTLACTVGGLGGFQVAALLVIAVAAFVLVYLIGRDDGREELRQNARENGVDPRWLEPVVQVDEDDAR